MERQRIIVTAGPTREYLDPVRFLSNPSTGKMGFAIAAEAASRGFDVIMTPHSHFYFDYYQSRRRTSSAWT